MRTLTAQSPNLMSDKGMARSCNHAGLRTPGPSASSITKAEDLQSTLTVPDIDEVDIWNFNFCWRCSLRKLQPINFKVSSNELIFLEVFAGGGNLSEAVRHKGLLVHAVDFKTKRKTGVASHILDLTRDSDLDVLLDMATHGNIASAHFAPPCGTASKVGRSRCLRTCRISMQSR